MSGTRQRGDNSRSTTPRPARRAAASTESRTLRTIRSSPSRATTAYSSSWTPARPRRAHAQDDAARGLKIPASTDLPASLPIGAPAWRASGGFAQSPDASSSGNGTGWRAEAGTTGRAILLWADPVDLRQATNPQLHFASWLSSRASTGEVQVSADGVTWQTAAVVPPSEAWTELEGDLSPFAGQIVYLRFVFDTVAPAMGVSPDVWRIDDVSVDLSGARSRPRVLLRPPGRPRGSSPRPSS